MKQSSVALSNVVRSARKRKNLSQEALAERIGVCKRTIIDIENESGNPKFEVLYPLVRELDLPLHQVFYPEIEESYETKTLLLQEVQKCNEYESKIILSIMQSLLHVLKTN